MKVKVYKDKPSIYVPDILFKDGTYPSKRAFIEEVRERDKAIDEYLKEKGIGKSKAGK